MRNPRQYVCIRQANVWSVIDRWKAMYLKGGIWYDADKENIYERLRALHGKSKFDPDAIAEIIGNKSWSYIQCDGCQQEFNRLVSIGTEDELHYFCEQCITEAYEATKELHESH